MTKTVVKKISAYAVALFMPAIFLFIQESAGFTTGERPMISIFLLPVILAAYLDGLIPSLLALVIGDALSMYYFLPPIHSISISYTVDWQRLIIVSGIGLIAILLFERLHFLSMRKESALGSSRNDLQTFLDNLPFIAWFKDKDMRFIAVNNPFVQASGASSINDIIGKTDLDVWPHPLCEGYYADDLEVVKSRKKKMVEEKIITNGQERWLETYKAPLFDNEGNIFGTTGFSRDITERKRTEESLRMIKHSIDNAAISIFWMNSRGEFTDANAQASKDLGYSHDELCSLTIFDVEPTLTRERWNTIESYLTKEKSIISFESTYRKKNGMLFPVEITVNIHSYEGRIISVFFVQDITQRKHVEEALKDSELKARLFVEHTPLPVAMFDTNMCYLMASKEWNITYKLGNQQLIGKLHYDIFPEIPERWKDDYRRVLAGEVYRMEEDRFERADGSIQWLRYEIHPWRKNNGEIGGIVMITEDITERKHAEEKLQRFNEELERRVDERTKELLEANKELESFGYTVSHDLRAPLRAIDSYTRILTEEYKSVFDAEGLRLASIVRREAQRMGQLIDDLLNFSRLGRTSMLRTTVDMTEMAMSVYEDLTTLAVRKQVEFRLVDLPPAQGDATLIHQVWLNLISNALKYSSKKEKPVIDIGFEMKNQCAVYIVRDNGAGFDMKYYNKLFGVFQRLHTTREYEGTGVGLAIVHRIIQRHGGEIWAEGKTGEGAAFYFSLPGDV